MARYAVGDLQGNLVPLLQLLDRVGFNTGVDELWLVGDVVNRGPESLESLRFVKDNAHCVRMVLGNHDLSLLAKANGIGKVGRKDTIADILAAPDANQLYDFLYQQPLALADSDWLMTHAGLPPIWSCDEALDHSAEVSTVLKKPKLRQRYFDQMYGNEPAQWHQTLQEEARWRVITNYFTRMRFCRADGTLEFNHSGSPDNAPADMLPWFEHLNPNRRRRVVFGHWAALMGATGRADIVGLDTGYVWGNQLTLMNIDTLERWQVQAPSS